MDKSKLFGKLQDYINASFFLTFIWVFAFSNLIEYIRLDLHAYFQRRQTQILILIF